MSQKQEENPAEETGEEKQDTQEKEGVLPERAEEAKLKAKYPSLGQKPGGSDFLMKRLQKGQKYFDSGDYNMAKAKMKNKQLPSAGPDKNLVTGDHIPTPQDLPQRKSSLVTSKLAGEGPRVCPVRWRTAEDHDPSVLLRPPHVHDLDTNRRVQSLRASPGRKQLALNMCRGRRPLTLGSRAESRSLRASGWV
ncbi:alpha-endosulfine isoform X1 [Microtus oregoni]|uniref:alpha-endosulfine isoform X1 n=1 Tax=Microtus oregoni TaxID=111838 RepID=UPI001BB29525|nr:alpha-endosulfine isoform X1 [Microtus oregoni]XP_041511317.1 alpha-endosulfine isoform X1 [Microtus oregoni]